MMQPYYMHCFNLNTKAFWTNINFYSPEFARFSLNSIYFRISIYTWQHTSIHIHGKSFSNLLDLKVVLVRFTVFVYLDLLVRFQNVPKFDTILFKLLSINLTLVISDQREQQNG